ncbi:MAG: cell division protein FtsQ/DivIB [Terracidiphilus sp.]
MPLDGEDPDDDGSLRFPRTPSNWSGDGSSGRPWWRPASTTGRVFLALCAFIVLTGLTTAAILLKTCLERDARFRIAGSSDIHATGLTQVSRAELLPVFGEDIGRNIFFVPLNERRKELEQIPWIERATVMRLLPDQIRVAIVERQPVAFTRVGEHIGLVDADGVLLSMAPAAMAAHHYSFPVLTGIDPRDPPAARKMRMDVYLRLMAALDSTGQHYSENISEIDLTDPEDARVLMPEQGRDILAHFGEDHFLERYLRYRAHIAQWRQQYPRLAAVDLRYDQQVVLEMASGAVASAAAGGADAAAGERKPSADGRVEGAPPAHAKTGRSSARDREKAARERRRRAEEKHAESSGVAQKRKRVAEATSAMLDGLPSGVKEAAEKWGATGDPIENLPSGAKARVAFVDFMYGLRPVLFKETSFFAAFKAHADFARVVYGLKPESFRRRG